MRHIGPPPTPITQFPGGTRTARTARGAVRRRRPRLDWGAVAAGLAVAAAIQVALTLFGRALGLENAPGRAGPARGLVAALWGSAAIAISLYGGARATGRVAGGRARTRGALHGVVLWALSTLLLEWLASAGGAPATIVEIAGSRETAAGPWLALVGLGVGLAAAVGGARGWPRR